MPEKRFYLIVSALVILLITLPYVYAFETGSFDAKFGGFLINPIDGHSYLAKMQQGYHNQWRFLLPYTAEPGQGAYLFLFYIGLGQLSRLSHVPLLIMYHAFRILGALFLLWSIRKFFNSLFAEKAYRNSAFLIAALGSGLGWIAASLGMFTSDLWVAEAFPFLSMYTNPHFPFGLGLMLLLLIPEKRKIIYAFFIGVLLGLIQPFGVVIVVLIKTVQSLVKLIQTKGTIRNRLIESRDLTRLIAILAGGGVILIYQYWAIVSDPVLAIWNRQNVTISPKFFDLLISFSPCLILGVFGIKAALKDGAKQILIIWALISFSLIAFPWNLQRRFLTGIYIPLVGLSVLGMETIVRKKIISLRRGLIILLFLVIPTNLIILASGFQAAESRDPKIYLDSSVIKGLDWIRSNTEPENIILSDIQTGLLIPSLTGRRVIYGHPFETVNALDERKRVEDFFAGRMNQTDIAAFLKNKKVDYVIYQGDLQNALASRAIANNLVRVYQSSDVSIYAVSKP